MLQSELIERITLREFQMWAVIAKMDAERAENKTPHEQTPEEQLALLTAIGGHPE